MKSDIRDAIEESAELFEKSTEMTEEFSDLLENIKYAKTETKKLWIEIYKNAIDDRLYAHTLFTDLYRNVLGSTEGHSLYGKQMSMYLERLGKSNDQLLRLAELVAEAAGSADDPVDADALYNSLSEK